MKHVLGIDAGGTKTRALLANEAGQILAAASAGGANLRTHGEPEVEKVLHAVAEEACAAAGARPDAVAVGVAGAGRAEDEDLLRAILQRIGYRDHVIVTIDAHIAFVAGSERGVGLALVCGTGSIAWGRNASGEVARAGGWGWQVGDEGSGYWIGRSAIREVLRAQDGRGSATLLEDALLDHFAVSRPDQIVSTIHGGGVPRREVSLFAASVERAALSGDAVAARILDDAAEELALAVRSVRERLRLSGGPHDVVLSGGTFRALPTLEKEVSQRVAAPGVSVRRLEQEPTVGAVKLALEAVRGEGP
ncbi:MAG TPA: BadF/BadG/BcrA/BcrD ATPase family protein [Thermoanaerobaculia bacterium]|nr:BadF/BadG/BcrA/BcrD ATPase family protein [Thermoanaerobaculia bacterium]